MKSPLFPVVLFLLGTGGAARADDPDMSALWPNGDGSSWTYEQLSESPPETTRASVSLHLLGTIIASGGNEVQNMVEEVGGSLPAAGWGPAFADPLLRNLWRARPDLRTAIEAKTRVLGTAAPAEPVWEAILLHGGAFEKNDEEIINWHLALSPGKSWIFLVSDLTIGTDFSLQLIPDLADDVFLYGTVAAIENVTVPAGSYSGCVRVDYRIDYGETTCGEGASTSRSETLGSVHYAPGVGPVRSTEDFIPYAEGSDPECADGGIGEVYARVTLSLTEEAVPVRETTWGRIKQRAGSE